MTIRTDLFALPLAVWLIGCSETSAPHESPPYEFVYVDSGGHGSFASNAVAQAAIREFVGASGDVLPGTTLTVSTTHAVDGIARPVELVIHRPTGDLERPDVVVLFHGTIGDPSTTPRQAAEKLLGIVRDDVGLSDRVLVSVAYPQDAIPIASQAEFGDVAGLLFGDNLVYAQSALEWVRAELPSWLATTGATGGIGRVFTLGHSQGGYLAHRLNARVSVDGVICNAPGPIDLLDRCRLDEQGPNGNITCNKIEAALGPTSTHPEAYTKRSLLDELTGIRARTLFLQAMDDDEYQVQLMQKFEAAFRAANP